MTITNHKTYTFAHYSYSNKSCYPDRLNTNRVINYRNYVNNHTSKK